MDIEYRLLEKEDREGAINCIAYSFYLNDLLGTALDISLDDWIRFADIAADKAIQDRISVVALDQQNIIGTVLSYGFGSYSPHDYEAIPSFTPIYHFMDELYQGYTPQGKIAHPSYGGVHTDYLKRGIAFGMVAHSINLAKEKEYEKAIIEVPSPYTQRIGFRLGFRMINEVFYKDFEYKGKKVFSNINLATSCMLMELRL